MDSIEQIERDGWIRLFNRLAAAVGQHKAKLETTEALNMIDTVDEALYAAHERVLRDAAQFRRRDAWLAANEEHDRADDQEDDQQREQVGMADRGEHGTPPVEEPSAPAPAESGDAEAESDETSEKWRKLDEGVDEALDALHRQVAGLALFLPDLPARHCQLIDDVVAMTDRWERSR